MKPIRHFALLCVLVLLALPTYATGKKKDKNTTLDAPKVTCAAAATGDSINLKVKAGSKGAPGGFTVFWILESELGSNHNRYSRNSGGGGHHGGDDDDCDDDDHHHGDDDDCDDDDHHHGDHDDDCDDDDHDHGDDDDNDNSWCQASFSGSASGQHFKLDPGESVTINLGASSLDTPGASSTCENVDLECNRRYVFRAFAHAWKKNRQSKWSKKSVCSTEACGTGGGTGGEESGCTSTRTDWLDRGPTASPDELLWPVNGMTIGNVFYTNLQLESILSAVPGSNGLIALARQLISAKLNVANGAGDNTVASAIMSADSLIGNLNVPPVGSGSLSNAATSALTATLQSFNEGAIGPGSCE